MADSGVLSNNIHRIKYIKSPTSEEKKFPLTSFISFSNRKIELELYFGI
jgi:hypothetical protein